ncbi:MAG: hypothetical protein HKN48_01015, partial [Flavobacteriaceae bacterium]|nr:hypothetical protein [Flavobacteriaceae bacterium]
KLTSEFTQKLSERNIEQYAVSKRHCSGTIEMFQINGKVCSSQGSYFEVYVIWKEEDTSFVKKIDNCGLYLSIPLPNHSISEFITENHDSMKEEEVKNYEIASQLSGPISRTTVQPCFREVSVTHANMSHNIKYNLFDLSNDGLEKNINYDYNNSLHMVMLDTKISEVIKTHQNKFRRQ